jgi:hypothetical protein
MRLSQFWQPKGVPRLWIGVKKKRGEGVFIAKGGYQLSEKAMDVC